MSYIEDNGYLLFNGENSSDYGVWINGGGTFNAPARRVKEYVVPGRNGTLTIDEGVFEDIDHVYPAFIPRDFQKNIETFRNILMANGGYVELEDSFHPDEYYMAKYISGLEVDVAPGAQGGAFNLRFRRDPRRFLKSGREIVTYPSGEKKSPNLLTYPYTNSSKTTENVKWTDNGDGTISTSGINTYQSSVSFTIKNNAANFTLPVGDYILTGCPKGGSSASYYMQFVNNDVSQYGYDYGDGVEFSVTNESHNYSISIYIASGYNTSGLKFKPMIQNKYGENLITWPYKDGETWGQYGVSFSATDGTVTTSGTATNNAIYAIRSGTGEENLINIKKDTEYKLTGCPAGGSSNKYYIYYRINGESDYRYDYGSGSTFTVSEDTYVRYLYISIRINTDSTGLVFKPLLRPTSPVERLPYTPYWDMETSLYNPTNFEAKPLIRVTGSDLNNVIHNGVVTINGHDITITEADDKYILIDSETQECYLERVSSMQNDKVSFSDHKFPVLKPGVNSITFSGDIENVQITPRWWII